MAYDKDRLQNLLRRIFDEIGYLNREQWSEVFLVSEDEIEKWVRGETLPSALTLRMLWKFMSEVDDLPKDLRDEMADIQKCRFEQISHLHPSTKFQLEFRFNSLGSYISSPKIQAFLRRLSLLNGERQEEFLDKAIGLFRTF